MINRSLIRIKVVQILYSYLLTRSDFKFESLTDNDMATPDDLFAYQVYSDYIYILLKLSGVPVEDNIYVAPDPVCLKNPVAKLLSAKSGIEQIISHCRLNQSNFNTLYNTIEAEISKSPAYDLYKRRRQHDLTEDVNFWNFIFNKIIAKSKPVEQSFRHAGNFSHKGMEKGLDMFSGTLNLLADTNISYFKALDQLKDSMNTAYQLYHALLYLPILITKEQRERNEIEKLKYIPRADALNNDVRLLGNEYVTYLESNELLNNYISDNEYANPENWKDGYSMISTLLDSILASEQYREYQKTQAGNFATDAAFWRDMMKSVILPSDALAESLESTSVYWNDDLLITGTFVLKSMRRAYTGADGKPVNQMPVKPMELLPQFINDDDARFGRELFDAVTDNRIEYKQYVDRFINSKTWDSERIAFMDIVLLLTAIAEIIKFPSIPVPVTCNEYVEIANMYSTPRSGQFINGLLGSVVNLLKENKVINK